MTEQINQTEIPSLEPDENNQVIIREELKSSDLGDERVVEFMDGRKARIPEGATLIVDAPTNEVNIG